jgi:hypothetical protein
MNQQNTIEQTSIRAHEHTKPRVRWKPRKPAKRAADVMQGGKEPHHKLKYSDF